MRSFNLIFVAVLFFFLSCQKKKNDEKFYSFLKKNHLGISIYDYSESLIMFSLVDSLSGEIKYTCVQIDKDSLIIVYRVGNNEEYRYYNESIDRDQYINKNQCSIYSLHCSGCHSKKQFLPSDYCNILMKLSDSVFYLQPQHKYIEELSISEKDKIISCIMEGEISIP